MPIQKVYNWKITAKKFIKGGVGGALIYALLRAGHGGGWEEVNLVRGMLEGVLIAGFALFEAIWNVVKFFKDRNEPTPAPPKPGPKQNFDHKDA